MQIQNNNNNLNFNSTWYIVNRRVFRIRVRKIGENIVKPPWTIKENIVAKSACTFKDFDCKTDGVTNGLKVLMRHICPTEPQNRNFNEIDNNLLKEIEPLRNEYLQGYVLGGKANNKNSPRSMESVYRSVDLFERQRIPYTRFIGGNYENDYAYFGDSDVFLIGNDLADYLHKIFKDNPLGAAKVIFDDVKLCGHDEIRWL